MRMCFFIRIKLIYMCIYIYISHNISLWMQSCLAAATLSGIFGIELNWNCCLLCYYPVPLCPVLLSCFSCGLSRCNSADFLTEWINGEDWPVYFLFLCGLLAVTLWINSKDWINLPVTKREVSSGTLHSLSCVLCVSSLMCSLLKLLLGKYLFFKVGLFVSEWVFCPNRTWLPWLPACRRVSGHPLANMPDC